MAPRRPSRPGGVPVSPTFLAAVLLLPLVIPIPACGGGGGGGGDAIVDTFDLGFVAVAGSTRVAFDFANPGEMAATVTAAGATGPFRIDPRDLPALAEPGGTVRLGVLCEPAAAGYVDGTVTLRFDTGSGAEEATWKLLAWAEPVSLDLLTTSLDFGSLLIGEDEVRLVTLYNRSTDSSAVVTGIDVPSADYTVEDATLPLTIPPATIRTFDLRFAPTTEGPRDGEVLVRSNGSAGPLTVAVKGSGRILGREEVTDYGVVTLDASQRTPLLTVKVPADAVSLSVEGTATLGDQIGLDALIGPGGFVYENTTGTGPYLWIPKVYAAYGSPQQAFLTTLPNSDRPQLQLVAGGGSYAFRLRVLSGFANTMRVRAFVERRAPEIAGKGILDLNVFFSPGCGLKAATAASDGALQVPLGRAEVILSARGIRLGEISYFDLSEAAYDVLSSSELDSLLQKSAAASEERLNLFFVQRFDPASQLGVSPTISGAKRKGTACSGVVCSLSAPTETRGVVIAHEIGHFLGLYHCVEANGAQDIIDDTPTGSNTGNLMDRLAPGTVVTSGQGFVMRAHPLVRMDPDAWSPAPLMLPLSDEARRELEALPAGWCGNCPR